MKNRRGKKRDGDWRREKETEGRNKEEKLTENHTGTGILSRSVPGKGHQPRRYSESRSMFCRLSFLLCLVTAMQSPIQNRPMFSPEKNVRLTNNIKYKQEIPK